MNMMRRDLEITAMTVDRVVMAILHNRVYTIMMFGKINSCFSLLKLSSALFGI